jgi:hypothetical protein
LYANYTLLNQRELNGVSNGRPTIMGHAYWGLHMLWGMRSPLLFSGYVSLDFSLGRAIGSREGCRAMRDRCEGPSCMPSDVLARPWHAKGLSALMPPPSERTPLTFKYGAPYTRYSCGESYFTCGERSRMCEEDRKTYEPMDRSVGRQTWLKCTKDVCKSFATDRYSVRCAGVLLAGWTAVWRHSPSPDWNRSLAMRDAGETDRSIFGQYDEGHSAAALNALSLKAAELFRSTKANGDNPPRTLHDLGAACTRELKQSGVAARNATAGSAAARLIASPNRTRRVH